MYIFKSLSSYKVDGGRFDCFMIECPLDIEKNNIGKWFGGMVVNIDGEDYKVLGVESYCLHIIKEGTPIGLKVEIAAEVKNGK